MIVKPRPEVAPDPARSRTARLGPNTIAGRLVLLCVSLLLPAAIVAAILLQRAYVEERRAAELQLADTSRALSLVMEGEISKSQVLLRALSTSRYLATGDYAGFDRQARAANMDPAKWVALVRVPTGRHVVNTLFRPGQRLPSGLTSERAGYTLLADGTRLWHLIRGSVSHQPLVIAARPVTLVDGTPAEILVVSRASSFLRIFAEQDLRPSWLGAVIDARGIIVARSRQQDRYAGQRASPAMRQAMARRPSGVRDSLTYDSGPSITAYTRSSATGWTLLVAVPRKEIASGARSSLIAGAILGLLLLGGGLLGAVLAARSVSRPIRGLVGSARDMADGRPVPLSPSGLREIDDVGRALSDAARALAEREQALVGLNQTLEARVLERTRELEEASETLLQAQKMEAVGRLTGGIAHDFNNLLTAVLGNIELAERRITDEVIARRLANAREAAERGARLTGQLLAFSRRQRLRPERMDVNAAILNAVDLLRSTLGSAVTLETRLEPAVWPIQADPTQFDLVILNLAINARDAMGGAGLLILSTGNRVLVDPPALPEHPAPGEYVSVSVADTGAGMTPEVRARIFEPFFTTKPVGQGTGLGLPQALGVLKQLGGGLDVHTVPGEGTVITLLFPRGDAAARASDEPDAEGIGVRGLRVLVIDDDPDVRGVAASILRDHGCAVSEASSGAEGLSIAAAGTFDAAIVDFAMPGMNGAETAAGLAAQPGAPPVLMMSGYIDVGSIAAQWNGPLLAKPFSAAALTRRLAEVAAGRGGA